MPEEAGLADVIAEQRELLSRLRAVVEAKDAENQVLRAELEAARERERRLELRLAELERRLRMDSTDSGTPTSKEPIGARERRRAERQESERERRKDRRRGGQPGHPGRGLARDPDPGERKDADPPAQCRRCGTGLDGAAPAAPGWAQVVDVQVTRTVTEWALPGLQCPCCGTAAIAAPPSGAHAGVGVVRAGAERRRGRADLVRERAAGTRRARRGHAAGCSGVSRVGGQGRRPAVPAAGAGRVRGGDVRGAGGRAGAGRGRDPGERAGPRHRPRRPQDKKRRTRRTAARRLPARRTCWSSGPRTSG